MADIEKARELLTALVDHTGSTAGMNTIRELACGAIAALDGDGAEEWTVEQFVDGAWVVTSSRNIAKCADARDARRIACLPALERAVQRAVDACPPGTILWGHEMAEALTRIMTDLRAALNQEDQS